MSKKKPIGADYWLHKPTWRKGSIRYWRDLPKRPKRIVKHKIDRAQNGYSWDDWINFDSYVGPMIAKAVKRFADEGHGFFFVDKSDAVDAHTPPYIADWENAEAKFKALCYGIHDDIMAYYNLDIFSPDCTYEEEVAALETAKAAMVLFSQNLGHWWD